MAEHYAAAGVSLEAGYKSVELIKEHVKKTMRPEVLGGLGGFSGAFSLYGRASVAFWYGWLWNKS